MGTLKVKIKDGLFESTIGPNLKSISKYKVIGNDWSATIEEDRKNSL